MFRSNYTLYFLFLCVLFSSCDWSNGSLFQPKRVAPPKIQEGSSYNLSENIGRSSWQKPELVLQKLGDVSGKTIVDIGSGTGYFTFRLAHLNAKVIALDIDQKMLDFINGFKENLPKDIQGNISTKLGKADDPQLDNEIADAIIIINTITYIEDLDEYIRTIKPSLKPGGMLMIVDFKVMASDLPAPLEEDRIPEKLVEELLKDAGYSIIDADDTSLEYQYIITAKI